MKLPDRFRFLLKRLGERLWFKPLIVCLLSIVAVFVAKLADETNLKDSLPTITAESIDALLSVMASSMLVIATFAVASMVSAYASASNTATPRAFRLVVADGTSQNALSTFIGAFIFSIVALTAVKNAYFQEAGLFALFVLTALVFGAVILTFVRWVDRIARLGRLSTSIEEVEAATARALRHRRTAPTMGGVAPAPSGVQGQAVYANQVGYVQRVDISLLQRCAEAFGGRVTVAALPGTFAMPGRPLAHVRYDSSSAVEIDTDRIGEAFVIGTERVFDDDPRFGLVVLSEIADQALSPGINDSGTAISILGSLARLFVLWVETHENPPEVMHERVEVPELSLRDLFDDSFSAIARDGAGLVEVMVRLQKVLGSLAGAGDATMKEVAVTHARLALARAERAMELPEDLARVRQVTAAHPEA